TVVMLLPTAGGEPRELMNGQVAGWAPDSHSILVATPTNQLDDPLRRTERQLWRVSINGESHKVNVDPQNLDLFTLSRVNPDGHVATLVGSGPGGGPMVRVIENFLRPLDAPQQAVQTRELQFAWFNRSGKQIEQIGSGADRVSGVELSPDGKHVATH